MTNAVHKKTIRSFAVRGGRISKRQRWALDTLARHYCFPAGADLSDSPFLKRSSETVVEIGFGTGNATAKIAVDRPRTSFLAIEVFDAGIGNLLGLLHDQGIENVRIIKGDAVEVFEHTIPDDTLSGIHLFFPDPWPKKGHHKRRIIQSSFVNTLIKKMRKEAYLYIVTDWGDYADHIKTILGQFSELEDPYNGVNPSISWRPKTRFEEKGIAKGHLIHEIYRSKT